MVIPFADGNVRDEFRVRPEQAHDPMLPGKVLTY